LIDFGIAAPVTRASHTARTEVFGSPGHMPPEQLHGAELTPATDVFAVGVLLIEAWTGYPPFRRATTQESEQALFTVPPPVDRQQPLLGPLRELIASSVALDARDRPVAAEHLARPLREFLKSEDSGDIARRLGERVRRARRRSRSSSPWLPGEGGTGEQSESTRPVGSEPPLPRESAGGSAPVTRTFAARDEVEVWTRRLSGAPAAAADLPATPAMPGVAQLPRKLEPAPLIDDSVREPSGISSSQVGGAPKPGSGWLLGAASLAFVAVAFVFAPRSIAPKAVVLQLPAATSTRPPEPALVPVEPSRASAAPPASAASSAPSALSSGPKADESARVRLSPSSASAEPEQFGLLKITADPRAAVEVSGPHFHQLGQSPIVGLKVPVGRYQVVFRNDTFGAPLSAAVTILSGVSRSVHADFRQAEPAVSVR
ncbi:MAG TPA: protein kinase, partial [Polyangiaceae bacterium]